MPEYRYRCRTCPRDFTLHQAITEAPLPQCEKCGAAVFRVMQPVGIRFVGSGFYANDSRSRSYRESAPKE